jgi:hypothetical protein
MVYGHAFTLFPALHRRYVAFQINRDFFPRIEAAVVRAPRLLRRRFIHAESRPRTWSIILSAKDPHGKARYSTAIRQSRALLFDRP